MKLVSLSLSPSVSVSRFGSVSISVSLSLSLLLSLPVRLSGVNPFSNRIGPLSFHSIFPLFEGAIWPSLSPCTVTNPILLTYFPLFRLNVHNNITQKVVQLEFFLNICHETWFKGIVWVPSGVSCFIYAHWSCFQRCVQYRAQRPKLWTLK